MRHFPRVMVIVLLVLPALSPAADRYYGAAVFESSWSVERVGKECRLRHAIPLYGEAVFSRVQSGELLFNLRVLQRATSSGKAKLTAQMPVWLDAAKSVRMGRLDFATGNTPFVLHEDRAWDLLRQLEQGRSPTFSYRDWTEVKDDITVTISAVHFYDALEEFHRCALAPSQAKQG